MTKDATLFGAKLKGQTSRRKLVPGYLIQEDVCSNISPQALMFVFPSFFPPMQHNI